MLRTFLRRYAAVACAVIAALLAVAPVASAAPIFKLADDATTVVWGSVTGVQPYKDDAFLVFTITPREVLKGSATTGTPVTLVEERVFGTEQPYYAAGADAFVFAIALPAYSYYRQSLPQGSHLQWAAPNEMAKDIATLADPVIVEAVRGYLAAGRDVRAVARHLGALLTSPVLRLRSDALTTIESRPPVAAALDAGVITGLVPFLQKEDVPLVERAAVLVKLARAGAPIADVASAVAAKDGPLRAAAVDALVTLKRPPGEKELLAWSRGDDPALRVASVRGLVLISSRPALDRVGAIVQTDPVPEVRIAAIEALGTSHDAGAIPVLAKAMEATDKREMFAASTALQQIASPDAIRALAEVLRNGNEDAATAAAFALAQTRSREAATILREQHELHPDQKVRNAIGLALGESGHHH